jgi:hypothetical protein
VEAIMGKKGGGSFYRPVMSSSAGMFAKKGDPWVTRREGERDFNRQVEVENPDMDADRQRNARIEKQPKEVQDRLKRLDAKMTMREAIETERSIRMDSYFAQKITKPKAGEWPKAGKDFSVEHRPSLQQRLANIAIRTRREVNALENSKRTTIVSGQSLSSLEARVDGTAKIACPRGCGYATHDSRNISKHLQKFRNSCCTHTHCNCDDCKYARNEL